MTTPQQAALEQAAREFLTDDKNEFDLSPTGEPYRFQVEALVSLLAAQRAAGLEEAAVQIQARMYAGNEMLYNNGLWDASAICAQQAQEQRP